MQIIFKPPPKGENTLYVFSACIFPFTRGWTPRALPKKKKKVLFKIDYLQESGGCLSKILTGYKLIIKSPFVFIFSKKEEVNLFIILISLNIFESYLKKKLDQSLTTYVKVSEKLK